MTIADAFGRSRDEVVARLAEQGIETRPFSIPLHTLPPFREGSRRRREDLPMTVGLAARGMNLPTYTAMTDAEVNQVCEAIRGLAHGLGA